MNRALVIEFFQDTPWPEALFEKDFFQVQDEDGTAVDYHYYADCADCGVRLFACSSADGNADEKLADNVAVPAGKRSFCAACYPNHTKDFGGSTYLKLGKCVRCGEEVYGHIAGPENHGAVGNQLAAHTRASGYLCQQHYDEWLKDTDPQAWSERHGMVSQPDGMVVDKWERPL